MFDIIQNLPIKETLVAGAKTAFYSAATIRYDGTPIPSNINTENWVFGVVFIFFIILILGLYRSYNWMAETFRNITKPHTRSSLFSKTATYENQSTFLLTIFSLGVISLYLYFSLNTEDEFKLSVYLLFLLSSMSFLVIKTQLMNIVGYVFIDQDRLKIIKKTYFDIFSLLGIFLSPLLILKMYLFVDVDPILFDFIAIILSLSGLILFSIITIKQFLHKILDFFHIMLYLCTLEILPLIGMFQLYILILKEC